MKLIREQADFDYGHKDATDLPVFPKTYQKKGGAGIETKGVYPRADNAIGIDTVKTIEMDEFADDTADHPVMLNPSQLHRLHAILNKANMTDQEIKAGPPLSSHGQHEIAKRLGIGPGEVNAMYNTLTQQLRDEEGEKSQLAEEYAQFMAEPESVSQLRKLGFLPESHLGIGHWRHPKLPGRSIDIGKTGALHVHWIAEDGGKRRHTYGSIRDLLEAAKSNRPFR